jgi:serine/threonine protein kinase
MLTVQPYEEFIKKYMFIRRLQYHVKENIEGSMSKIYIVQHKQTKKICVCKRVTKYRYNENEWKYPALINSPRVMQYLGVYNRNNEYYYLISNYFEDNDLFSCIEDIDFTEHTLRPYIREICLCIKEIHDRDIIHLDVKTENFIVRQRKPVLQLSLIDFGFAQAASQTKLEKAKGTEMYCAPEIFKDFICSKASDIFSIGMIIVLLLRSDIADMRDETDDIRKIVRAFSNEVSSSLKELVEHVLCKNPKDRWTIDQILNSKWLTESTSESNIVSSESDSHRSDSDYSESDNESRSSENESIQRESDTKSKRLKKTSG